MSAPAIGQRKRWAPGPGSRLDTNHPLAPACAWIPAMGLRTIHGDPVTASTLSLEQDRATSVGPAMRYAAASSQNHGWRNRVTGSRTDLTFAAWGLFTSGTTYGGCLFTRGNGIAATGLCTSNGGGAKWNATWNDDSNTYNYIGGPSLAGEQFVVAVVRAASIQFWVDAALLATNTVTNAAVNFSNLSGATAWQTYDNFGSRQIGGNASFYGIWDRALNAAEIAELFADPFQYMRR